MEAHAGDLARLLTSEQGKPLADATGEVLGMAAFFRYLGSLDLPMKGIEGSGDPKGQTHRRPHPLELPPPHPSLQTSLRADRRQHPDREARADHAAVLAAFRRTDQGR